MSVTRRRCEVIEREGERINSDFSRRTPGPTRVCGQKSSITSAQHCVKSFKAKTQYLFSNQFCCYCWNLWFAIAFTSPIDEKRNVAVWWLWPKNKCLSEEAHITAESTAYTAFFRPTYTLSIRLSARIHCIARHHHLHRAPNLVVRHRRVIDSDYLNRSGVVYRLQTLPLNSWHL